MFWLRFKVNMSIFRMSNMTDCLLLYPIYSNKRFNSLKRPSPNVVNGHCIEDFFAEQNGHSK